MLLSPDVTELTRLKGRMLHDACRDLGIGQTSQGARRYFSDIEAAVLVLATRLGAQGMRRAETLIVAEEAKPELVRLLRNPASARRWLFAHLNDDGLDGRGCGRYRQPRTLRRRWREWVRRDQPAKRGAGRARRRQVAGAPVDVRGVLAGPPRFLDTTSCCHRG